jgi:hypothetical protein
MFQRVYDSPWHNPFLFLVVAGVMLAVLAARRPPRVARFLWAWSLFFTIEAALDAFLTGGWSPLLAHHASLIGTVAVPFVILGDLRYFVLVERLAREPEPTQRTAPGVFGAAMAWSLVVPVLAFGTARIAPHAFADPRRLFLLYEVMFVVVASVFRAVRLRARAFDEHADLRTWARRLTNFELTMYALWAAADVVILAGHDAGFGVRLVPNILYYAAFVPFAFFTAPESWHR